MPQLGMWWLLTSLRHTNSSEAFDTLQRRVVLAGELQS